MSSPRPEKKSLWPMLLIGTGSVLVLGVVVYLVFRKVSPRKLRSLGGGGIYDTPFGVKTIPFAGMAANEVLNRDSRYELGVRRTFILNEPDLGVQTQEIYLSHLSESSPLIAEVYRLERNLSNQSVGLEYSSVPANG